MTGGSGVDAGAAPCHLDAAGTCTNTAAAAASPSWVAAAGGTPTRRPPPPQSPPSLPQPPPLDGRGGGAGPSWRGRVVCRPHSTPETRRGRSSSWHSSVRTQDAALHHVIASLGLPSAGPRRALRLVQGPHCLLVWPKCPDPCPDPCPVPQEAPLSTPQVLVMSTSSAEVADAAHGSMALFITITVRLIRQRV